MNIWQIQQELLSIFDELEENGGELTEELEQQLAISQENFRSKVESYTNVIKSVKADIAAIDQESKRLAELKKSKTAIVDRLSKVIIEAVDRFGDTTKTGGKFFDYGTGKVSIRNSQKVELDESKVDAIGDEFGKAFAVEAMLGNASNRDSFTVEDMMSAVCLAIALRCAFDDDDDSIVYNLSLYEADRLASEAWQFTPPGMYTEAKKLFSQPIAAQSIISDAINAMGLTANYIINGEDADLIFQSGRFANQNKIGVYVERRIPIWRNIKSITDIKENNHYYKLGDNMLSLIPVKDIAHWIKK